MATISTLSEIGYIKPSVIKSLLFRFLLLSTIQQTILVAILSCIITFIFHSKYKTENKVIYKLFNIACSFVIIVIIDTLEILNFTALLNGSVILGEMLLIVFTPFISQLFYDWLKELFRMIKGGWKQWIKRR